VPSSGQSSEEKTMTHLSHVYMSEGAAYDAHQAAVAAADAAESRLRYADEHEIDAAVAAVNDAHRVEVSTLRALTAAMRVRVTSV
jgi:hypothetical protein